MGTTLRPTGGKKVAVSIQLWAERGGPTLQFQTVAERGGGIGKRGRRGTLSHGEKQLAAAQMIRLAEAAGLSAEGRAVSVRAAE